MIKTIKVNYSQLLFLLISFTLLCFITACGGSKDGDTDPGPDTTPTAASLTISASSPTVSSDNSDSTTLTVTAIDSSSALVPDLAINMTTDTGILGAATVTTDATGKATVTFAAGSSPINRTATITATSGTISALIPIQIVGSTVTMTPTSASLSDSGSSSVTLTVTAKNSGGSVFQGAAVTMSQTGAGSVTFGSTAGTTNSSGVFTTTITGASAGNVTVIASALGTTVTSIVNVSAVADTFAIDQQTLDGSIIANDTTTAMKINTTATPYTPHSLNIQVHAPTGVTQVTFVTSIGVWDGGSSKVVTKTVSGNSANATLTTTKAGISGVQVYKAGNTAISDTLTVAMSSGEFPAKIMLQAAPTIVPLSVGTTTGSSTLTATVYDASNNPLGGLPVAFSIVDGTSTSGGETVLPVVATTAEIPSGGLSVGQARASFTSGSMPSGGSGVQIRASVVGTSVETEPIGVNITDSGNDQAIVIGGVAGSIAFGEATVINEDSTKANYIWPMSILVADSNGNAVKLASVSLSLWPIAWSTGVTAACAYDADNSTNQGTFYNEDINENLILDAGEDGKRDYYAGTGLASSMGSTDSQITPKNSDGGTVPSTVTTDSNGVAGFNLTYPKQSAIWTVVRIRATTSVQGSETRGEIILRLPCTDNDCVSTCRLSPPYTF